MSLETTRAKPSSHPRHKLEESKYEDLEIDPQGMHSVNVAGTSGTSTAPAVSEEIRDRTWAAVGTGSHVTMAKRGHSPFVGLVDDRTADGRVLWVLSTTGVRKLFHIEDGYILGPGPR